MEWGNKRSIQLIELYRSKPELWQPHHSMYHNKNRKHDAWLEISTKLESTVDIVKAKMNSLLSSFRRERSKEHFSLEADKGQDEIYESRWFAYKNFDFLLDRNKRRKSINNLRKRRQESSETKITNEDTPDDTEKTLIDDVSSVEHHTNTLTEDTPIDFEGPVNTISSSVQPQTSNLESSKAKKKKPNVRETTESILANFRINKAIQILEDCSTRDESDIYGEHIAMKLKNYSKHTRAVVQHLFNDILFNADMGQYDRDMHNRIANTVNNYHANYTTQFSSISRPVSRTSTSSTLAVSPSSNDILLSPRSPYSQFERENVPASTILENPFSTSRDGSSMQEDEKTSHVQHQTDIQKTLKQEEI